MPFVFAFGSNLYRAQMKRRCPSARIHSTMRVLGYRLSFVAHSTKWGGGVATLELCPTGRTHGVVWEVSRCDLEALDRFEGVPFCYERITLTRACYTYKHRRAEIALPSDEYVQTILEGYRQADLPTQAVFAAVRRCRRFMEQREAVA